MKRRLMLLTLSLICGAAHAQDVLPASTPLSADELTTCFRVVLEERYDPARSEQISAAHVILEGFFAEPATRDLAVERLSAVGLPPTDVARLCAVRAVMLPEIPGVYHVKTRVGPNDVDYVLGIPAGYSRTAFTPLLVRLTNADDSPEQVTAYVEKKLASEPKTLVMVPLYDPDERWGPGLIGMGRVTHALRHAANLVNIDQARISLVGSGPAARGVWDVGLHFPSQFAALGVMAGRAGGEYERVRLPNLLNVHVALWHDAKDDVIPIDETRQIARIFDRFKQPFDFVETKGLGHVPDEPTALKIDGIVRSKRRALSPRRVIVQSNRPELQFNRVDWLAINQPRQAGEQRRSMIARSKNILVINPLVFRADAEMAKDNVLEMKTDNVDSLRVYLDDTLCDFTKPLVVRMNRKDVFNGIIAPRYDVVLRDQQLFGRGVRAYAAAVDLETVKGDWKAFPIIGPATRPTSRPTTKPATKPA